MIPVRLLNSWSRACCGLVLGGALLALSSMPAKGQRARDRTDSPWSLWSESGSDDWNEARRLVHANEARPIMEALARRSRDSEGSVRAAYWMGLYHYGSGDPALAATYFDLAAAGQEPEVARQARVWLAQCRQLAGEAVDTKSAPPGELRDLFEVRDAVSQGDAAVRAGRPLDAMRAYLALEGDARRLDCLSWIYYRLGLILTAAGPNGGGGLDWDTLSEWDPVVATSPERALISKLRDAPRPSEAPRDSETPFAEPVVEAFPNSVSPKGPGEFPDSLFPDADAGQDDEHEPIESSRESLIYALQLGAFRDRDSARRAMEQFTSRGLSVRLEQKTDPQGDRLHLIWLGRCETREEAQAIADRLLDGIDYQIVTGRP